MKYSHESEELNALLGKKVKITLWDNKIVTGVLTRAEWNPDKYCVSTPVYGVNFRKTHIKKIEVVR